MPLLNHTINTKVLGLSTEQSIALMGGNVGAANANAARPTEEETKEEPADEAAPASPLDFMTHVMAIEALLTPEEAQLARQAIGQMPPAVLVAWKERLLSMSPEDAAQMVKGEIHKNAKNEKEAA